MDTQNTYFDPDLVEMAKRDPEKFGLLMERYQDQLFFYLKRLGQVSNEDAEDLLQEVFIKIYQKLNEYDEQLKFSSWIYRIAHNTAIDHFRRSNVRPKTDALEDYAWEKLLAASFTIEKNLIDKDCAENIKACIAELPLKYREVLILRFLEEKEYEEIMDILKKPKGSVATLIARGRELLKKNIAEKNLNCL